MSSMAVLCEQRHVTMFHLNPLVAMKHTGVTCFLSHPGREPEPEFRLQYVGVFIWSSFLNHFRDFECYQTFNYSERSWPKVAKHFCLFP